MSPRFHSLICVMICDLVKIHTSIQIEDLEVYSRLTSWSRAFEQCERFAGSELFQHCQPESCNASAAIGRIKDPPEGNNRKEYWINGYVKRSPVVVYEGCFTDVFSGIEDLNVVNTSFGDNSNSLYVCSKFCEHLKDGDFLFFQADRCYCVSESTYVTSNIIAEKVVTSGCSTRCDSSSGLEWCGGRQALFSGYKIVGNYSKIPEKIGNTCGIKDRNLVYTSCSLESRYMCDIVNSKGIFEYSCSEGLNVFKEAQKDCYTKNGTLYLTNFAKLQKCNLTEMVHWTGYFASEEIVWDNKDITKGSLCLKLVYLNGKYAIEARDCSEPSYSLCISDHNTSSNESNDGEITDENLDQDNVQIRVPVIVGAVVGGVGVVILIGGVLFFCKRKQNENPNIPSVASNNSDGQTEYYSSCAPDATSQPQESHRLINVTPEGVYNQLGDELPLKPGDQISSLYDVTGQVENEYDVSNTGTKPRENETGLYDDSRIVEDVYNTTNSENMTDKPISDTYHVPNI